jgi:LAS superfamily LD-carboxypeptidase LdcB
MESLLKVEGRLKKNMTKRKHQPIPLIIVQSFRSRKEQARIYNSGVRPCAPPGWSYHEQGVAVDVYFKPSDLPEIRKAFKAEHWYQFDEVNDPGHFSKLPAKG